MLGPEKLTESQRKAVEEMTAGPRGGVKGPFIPLLRTPELMSRLQRVGEYLRFQSSLNPRISEFLMLIVSREWTQQFEWYMHVPLALKAGLKYATISSLAKGRRPFDMTPDEELAYDFATELLRSKGVSDETYKRALEAFDEVGIIDLIGVVGYFATVSMMMNVAHTAPSAADEDTPRLPPLPL
jgi:4-carboxymuconolactone decarboxylase